MNTTKHISPKVAVTVGMIVVNVPVVALLIVPAFVVTRMALSNALLWALPFSFVAAWAWWAFSVPHWRLWAYQRVDSTGAVQRLAVAAGLLWPRGSFFERTEIKSLAQRQRQQRFEADAP